MASGFRAPKGTKDILPGDSERWQHVEDIARGLLSRYRFREIRTPIFEDLGLFARGVGEHTDIVSKEMYVFSRKGEREDEQFFALRPENTAGVVRAFVEHKLYGQPGPHKLWYMGPMFRYEAPQAGRQRQFHQLGVEVLGSEDPRVDAECIVLAVDLLDSLGLSGLEVQLNSVGCPVCRPAYRDRLQHYLRERSGDLCDNCVTRTENNPLRVLDCKVKSCGPIIAEAPSLESSLCEDCRMHEERVEAYLDRVGVSYRVNPRLVRGLDYYTRTVFEIVAASGLGAQNTVCAGGRYNKLVEEIGGPETPGVGWAAGVERLMMLLPEEAGKAPRLDGIFLTRGLEAEGRAFELARGLRAAGLSIEIATGGKFDKQFKQAERLGARFALILGEDELASRRVTVKDLDRREQTTIDEAALGAELSRMKTGTPE